MGNGGFGVLNNSSLQEINVGLSMAAMHYFENSVKYGEIFYRRPGAVWYTVIAFARQPDGSNDITKLQVAKEVTLAVLIGGGAAVVAGAALLFVEPRLLNLAGGIVGAGSNAKNTKQKPSKDSESDIGPYESAEKYQEDLRKAFEGSKLKFEKEGCYGGGKGSWLIVEGGPFINSEGYWKPRDLTIRETDQKEVFEKGNFTEDSHRRYHTKEGLQCTPGCPHCKKKE